ncbi:MAG: PEPxxWA-CTERM sorting domain-containing protein, partial [Pontixanthobacter sp.]
ESFANRSQPTSLTFSGSNGTITAGLDADDGEVRNSSGSGRFATDGTNFYSTGSNFTIDFNSPIAAFGFYGTDFGDFPGQVTVSLLRDGFADEELLVRSSVDAPNASLLFFGAIDSANPFDSVRFSTTTGEDFIGLDQLTIGDVNQVAGAVPEPSTWALLLLGFAFVGGTMRARNRKTVATLSYS